MKKATRIGLGTALLFAVLAAGFSAGYVFFKHQSRQRLIDNAIAESRLLENKGPANVFQKKSTPKPLTNTNLYYFTPPSVGILLNKKEINLPKGTLFPLLILSPEEARQYPRGQKIVFYDDNNKLLDLIGEITDSFPAKEQGKTAVLVSIRALDTELINKVSKAYLAMDVQQNIARLPLSAIITGEDGSSHVWELADESEGAATTYLKGIIVKSRHDGYVVIEPNISSSGDYITNPDDNLKDGGRVQVERKYFEGPAIAECDAIAQKIDDGFAERQQAFKREQDAIAAANQRGSCAPAQASILDDFIQKTRDLAIQTDSP